MKAKTKKSFNSDAAERESRNKQKLDNTKSGTTKMSDIGKQYERIPHPTLKNTFILREKK